MKSFVGPFGFLLCDVILNGIIKPINVEAQHVQDFKVVFSLNILERVTDYGQTAKLFCDVGPKFKTPVGFWDIFIPEPTLAFAVVKNESQRNDTKYSGQFVDNGFTLEIRNLSKDDLNISYKCSVDNNVSVPLLLLEADVFSGNLHLVVEQKVKYGETIKLVCVTESCNNKTCQWKYGWRRYLHGFEFEMERFDWRNSGDSSKYNSYLVNAGFILEIRNVSITDLNIHYECYLPFNKSELLNLTEAVAFEDILFIPDDNDKGLGAGVITAIIFGVLICLLLLIFLIARKHIHTTDSGKQYEKKTIPSELPEIAPLFDNGIKLCEMTDAFDGSLLNNSRDDEMENTVTSEEPEKMSSQCVRAAEYGDDYTSECIDGATSSVTADSRDFEDDKSQDDSANVMPAEQSQLSSSHIQVGRVWYAKQSMVVFDVLNIILRNLVHFIIKPNIMLRQVKNRFKNTCLDNDELEPIEAALNTLHNGYDRCATDILLKLIILLNCLPEPSNGWHCNPKDGSTALSDDIQRIRCARKSLFLNPKGEITKEEHDNFFRTFIAVTDRLDVVLQNVADKSFRKSIEHIKMCQLETNNIKLYAKKGMEMEQVKFKNSKCIEEIKCSIYAGKSLEKVMNLGERKKYEEKTLVLSLSTSTEEMKTTLLQCIRSIESIYSPFINITKVDMDKITMTVHPYILQDYGHLTTELLTLLRKITENADIPNLRIVDAVLSSDQEMTSLTKDVCSLLFEENRGKKLDASGNDLLLTAHLDKNIHLFQKISSLSTEISETGGSTTNVDIIMNECIKDARSQTNAHRDAQVQAGQQFPSSLVFKSKYDTDSITACACTDTSIVVVNGYDKKLTIIDRKTDKMRYIILFGYAESAVMMDNTRLVVSYKMKGAWEEEEYDLNVINIITDDANCIFKLTHKIDSLAYNENKFYILHGHHDMKVIDICGNIIYLCPFFDAFPRNITVHRNRIYGYQFCNKIHCFDMYGKMLWTSQNEVMGDSCCMTTDNIGNLFVGSKSEYVTFISADGEIQRQLNSELKLLVRNKGDEMNGICYNKATHELIICSKLGNISVFDVRSTP